MRDEIRVRLTPAIIIVIAGAFGTPGDVKFPRKTVPSCVLNSTFSFVNAIFNRES